MAKGASYDSGRKQVVKLPTVMWPLTCPEHGDTECDECTTSMCIVKPFRSRAA